MRFRFFALAVFLACAGVSPASAQLHKVFPWFHRADPAIERHVFVSSPDFQITSKQIGILPFESSQQGEPAPPPFAPFLRQALAQRGIEGALLETADPSGEVREAGRSRIHSKWRIAHALDRPEAAGVALLATGRIEGFFRTASGGMVIKVSAELWDADRRAPVWSGRIALDWLRRYSTEDCMLRAAVALVDEWESAGPRE